MFVFVAHIKVYFLFLIWWSKSYNIVIVTCTMLDVFAVTSTTLANIDFFSTILFICASVMESNSDRLFTIFTDTRNPIWMSKGIQGTCKSKPLKNSIASNIYDWIRDAAFLFPSNSAQNISVDTVVWDVGNNFNVDAVLIFLDIFLLSYKRKMGI